MTWLIMILAALAAVVLENVLPAWDFGAQARLPAVLCVVMYYALNHPPPTALSAGIAAGVMADAVAGLPTGMSPLIFCLLVTLVSRYRGFVFIRQWLTHMAIGALSGAAVVFMMYLLLAWRIEPSRALSPLQVTVQALGAGLLGMIFMPLVFWTLDVLEKMTGHRRDVLANEFGISDRT